MQYLLLHMSTKPKSAPHIPTKPKRYRYSKL